MATSKKVNLSAYQKKMALEQAEKESALRQEFATKIQELQEQQKQAIQECIATEQFPAEQIHVNFSGWLSLALPHETTSSMGTSYPDFKKQWVSMCNKKVTEFNMQEMGLAINCVESKSMIQLETTSEHYIRLQDSIAIMALSWNVHMDELKKPITEKYKKLSEDLRNEYTAKKGK